VLVLAAQLGYPEIGIGADTAGPGVAHWRAWVEHAPPRAIEAATALLSELGKARASA